MTPAQLRQRRKAQRILSGTNAWRREEREKYERLEKEWELEDEQERLVKEQKRRMQGLVCIVIVGLAIFLIGAAILNDALNKL